MIPGINPKEARLRLGLNQSKMAKAMGVHRQTWVKWERAERKPGDAAKQLLVVLIWLEEKNMLADCLSSI